MTDSVRFRQRLAEALSRGGLNERQVMAEVLLLLPEQFLTAYEVLYLETWQKASGSVVVGDPNAEKPVAVKWRTSSGQTETRGGASKKGHGSVSKGLGIKSVRAAATKEWADRRLRAMAREITQRMGDEDTPIRRCSGARCRKLAEARWVYCPYCGAATQDED